VHGAGDGAGGSPECEFHDLRMVARCYTGVATPP
jgi:hypothetical protein